MDLPARPFGRSAKESREFVGPSLHGFNPLGLVFGAVVDRHDPFHRVIQRLLDDMRHDAERIESCRECPSQVVRRERWNDSLPIAPPPQARLDSGICAATEDELTARVLPGLEDSQSLLRERDPMRRPFFACSAGTIQRSPCMYAQVARCASPIRCPVSSRNRSSGKCWDSACLRRTISASVRTRPVPSLDRPRARLRGHRWVMPRYGRHRTRTTGPS